MTSKCYQHPNELSRQKRLVGNFRRGRRYPLGIDTRQDTLGVRHVGCVRNDETSPEARTPLIYWLYHLANSPTKSLARLSGCCRRADDRYNPRCYGQSLLVTKFAEPPSSGGIGGSGEEVSIESW